jgi:CheY-like chemotaxis protein
MQDTDLPGGDRNSSETATAARQIVVVEDDPATLAGWIELLGAAGYAVTGATTFEAGRNALRTAPNLVIADVRLGAYNGLQLIMRARAGSVDMPVIVITGYPDDVIRRDAERLGAVYLEKPVHPDNLLAAVAKALERGSELAPREKPEFSPAVPYRTLADDRERRRWSRPDRDAVRYQPVPSPPRPNPARADEPAAAWRQVPIEDGDIVVVREPAGVDRTANLRSVPSTSRFRLSVRGANGEPPRLFASYERAVADGEALAAERRSRLFYVETGILLLLKDHRPPSQE